MKAGKRSPLTANPLRLPGQSIDEEIQKIIDEKVHMYLMIPLLLLLMTGWEWWRWYKNPPPVPLVYTVLAVGITAYSAYRLIQLRKRVKNLRLGRDGERVVGQYLETLRKNGFRIFHDIVGDRFNLDHIVICEQGIFVIETKTYSKPRNGEAKVVFKDNQFTINGIKSKTDIVTQARAAASWLRSTINEMTGKDFHVRTVVVFPGWYVESHQNQDTSQVWALAPKALPEFIGRLPSTLTEDQVNLVSFHVSRFIRTMSS